MAFDPSFYELYGVVPLRLPYLQVPVIGRVVTFDKSTLSTSNTAFVLPKVQALSPTTTQHYTRLEIRTSQTRKFELPVDVSAALGQPTSTSSSTSSPSGGPSLTLVTAANGNGTHATVASASTAAPAVAASTKVGVVYEFLADKQQVLDCKDVRVVSVDWNETMLSEALSELVSSNPRYFNYMSRLLRSYAVVVGLVYSKKTHRSGGRKGDYAVRFDADATVAALNLLSVKARTQLSFRSERQVNFTLETDTDLIIGLQVIPFTISFIRKDVVLDNPDLGPGDEQSGVRQRLSVDVLDGCGSDEVPEDEDEFFDNEPLQVNIVRSLRTHTTGRG